MKQLLILDYTDEYRRKLLNNILLNYEKLKDNLPPSLLNCHLDAMNSIKALHLMEANDNFLLGLKLGIRLKK